ncbi:unnamed protein product [Musa acuminata var. zebrina]
MFEGFPFFFFFGKLYGNSFADRDNSVIFGRTWPETFLSRAPQETPYPPSGEITPMPSARQNAGVGAAGALVVHGVVTLLLVVLPSAGTGPSSERIHNFLTFGACDDFL